jgi:hypothetical protein
MQKGREIYNRRKLGSPKITNHPKEEFESQTKALLLLLLLLLLQRLKIYGLARWESEKNENLNLVAARLAWQLTKSRC